MPSEGKPTGISDKLWDKIKNRVRREESGSPVEGGTGPEDPDIDPGLWGKIKKRVKDLLGPEAPKKQDPLKEGPLDQETIRYRIQTAGRLNVLLLMRYNGQLRHVEPYSFRVKRKKPKGKGPLSFYDDFRPITEYFYGFCLLHSEIHAFKMDKIEEIYLTDQKYSPRWIVEF